MQEYERVVYSKNPLDKVILQLKFPPILLIDSEQPALFQEKVRHMFPYYVPSVENIIISGQQLPAKRSYRFSEDSDSKNKYNSIILDRESISLYTTKYESWEVFLNYFQKTLSPFEECYSPKIYTRIGLRYTDIISRKILGLENQSWNDLINEKYLGFLSGDFEKNVIMNKNEYLIKLSNENNYMVNTFTGIIKHPNTGEDCFFIDSDFSLIGKIEIRAAMEHINELHKYSRPIFRSIIKDNLHNAMEPNNYE